jgi:lysyl-tRNA synthetase class 2
MSRDVRIIAKEREIVNNTIRSFFCARGYVEVETPVLVRSPGMEPNLVPFETNVIEPDGKHHHAGLITSPEYSMKKLLGLGMEKIFTLAKVFRNEENLGGTHNPEFTMLEWYRQGADYVACMDETEELVTDIYAAFDRVLPLFRRARVRDLFLEYVGIDLDLITAGCGDPAYSEALRRHGIRRDPSDTESDLYYRLFLALVEPKLGTDPIFVYDYPIHQASLSRLTTDGKYGERFELYVDGLELCNAFTELVDADEQRRRFFVEAEERRALGKTVFPVDEELLALLPSVRQPTFGNALGVDRLHMLATGKTAIDDVLLFPANHFFNA